MLAWILGSACISLGGSDSSPAAAPQARVLESVPDGEPGSQMAQGASPERGTPVEAATTPVAQEPARAQDPRSETIADPPSEGVARAASGADEASESPELEQPVAGDLRIERGAGRLALDIPRDEQLVFEVEVDLGALGDPTVGKVTLSSGVDPYVDGLPPRTQMPRRQRKEVGWIKSTAKGSHLGYELDHVLHVRHLPQVMPRILFSDTQQGSEARRRKLKLGEFEGQLTGVYEHDGHCKDPKCANREHFIESKWVWGSPYHCEKCRDKLDHRVWRDPQSRTVPEGTLDMLSAVYLARSMVRSGDERVEFPLLDKQKLWTVELKRGKTRKITVPAGTFECVEIQLRTSVPSGEKDDGQGFAGLFGIQGTIQIFFEARSGVPVLIAGSLPVAVIGELDVRVELKSSKGVPPEFRPMK